MSLAILDIILILSLILFIIFGFKNGMIKSFLYLLNSALSWFISIYISKALSLTIYNFFISPVIMKNTETFLSNKTLKKTFLFDKFPDFVVNFLPNYGITLDKITHIMNSVSKEVLPKKMSEFLMPGITDILRLLISGIVFIILILLGKKVVKLILKAFKIKALNYFDKVIGAIFGFLKGYIFISVVLCLTKIFIPFIGSNNFTNYIETSSSSNVVFKYMYNENPLYNLIKKV